jgi:hypothetical protein
MVQQSLAIKNNIHYMKYFLCIGMLYLTIVSCNKNKVSYFNSFEDLSHKFDSITLNNFNEKCPQHNIHEDSTYASRFNTELARKHFVKKLINHRSQKLFKHFDSLKKLTSSTHFILKEVKHQGYGNSATLFSKDFCVECYTYDSLICHNRKVENSWDTEYYLKNRDSDCEVEFTNAIIGYQVMIISVIEFENSKLKIKNQVFYFF